MRNRFHALCPYFAMFPEVFVEKHLIYSKAGDWVLDPFSGRGTTPLQCLLSGRKALALDVNPVATCVSRAKIAAPERAILMRRIDELREDFTPIYEAVLEDEFYEMCFHRQTLLQILFLKHKLDWRKKRGRLFYCCYDAWKAAWRES